MRLSMGSAADVCSLLGLLAVSILLRDYPDSSDRKGNLVSGTQGGGEEGEAWRCAATYLSSFAPQSPTIGESEQSVGCFPEDDYRDLGE